MAQNYQAPTVSDLGKRVEEISALQKSLLTELKGARRPVYSAQKTIRRMAGDLSFEKGEAPFRSFGDFLCEVKSCNEQSWVQNPKMVQYDKALKSFGAKYKTSPLGMSETIGSAGGFLVPPEFTNQLLMRVYDNDLLSRTTMFPIGGLQLKIPAVNEKSRQNGSRFGGIQAYWAGEAATVSNTRPDFQQVNLELSKLMLFVRLTDELLADTSVALETYLDTIADQEFAFKIGQAIVGGTGQQQPLGLLNSPSLVTVNKDVGQASGSLVFDNIADMWARLHVSCKPNAVWLIDPSVTSALFQLQVGYFPVYMPAGGASDKPYATLFGRPVIETEFQNTLGTTGDIILTDLSTYLTGTRGGIQSAMSIHAYWLTDEQSFRFTYRMDGKSWWLTPLTPFNGSSQTLSNIIALQTR